ncbi:WXG100 family type VII secretion target [Schaalia suimastitidis]|uniref:WXG100 family type VII secretion target n=1 Tax=Schaalia suimastitidis TaxID=121163 RepID=UPI00041C9BC0|nr:hypothetical protein [Schaalia suimastitidis]
MSGKDVMPLPPDTSEACAQVAHRFGLAASEVSASQVAGFDGQGVPGWIGQAADAYTDQVASLGARARTWAESLAQVPSVMRNYADQVQATIRAIVPLWAEYDEAQKQYERDLRELEAENAASEKLWGPGGLPGIYANRLSVLEEQRSDTQGAIYRKYTQLLIALDEEARGAATKVSAALALIVDPASAASTRQEVGKNLFNDIPVVDAQAEWEWAQSIAPAIAAALHDTDLNPEELEAFCVQYSAVLDNPFVATALAEHVTPADLVKFALRAAPIPLENYALAEDALRRVGAAMVLGSGGMNLDGDNAQAQTLFELARGAFVTETGGTVDELHRRFADGIKDAGRSYFNVHNVGETTDPISGTPGYELMSQLIGEAGRDNPQLALGPAFFDPTATGDGISVAEDLVLWDSQTLGWATLHGYDFTTSFFGPDKMMCDPMHAMYTLMDRPENLDTSTAHPIIAAADHERLAAVQRFLDGMTPPNMDVNHDGIVDDRDKPTNMTRYLTGGRTTSYLRDYFGFQDGGEQFGRVIQQASQPEAAPTPSPTPTEEYAAWLERDRLATNIAANFMFGYQDGLDANHDHTWFGDSDKVDGQDIYGHTNAALRSWAGVILAPHIEGIAHSLQHPDIQDEVAPYDPDGYQISFSSKMRARLLGGNGVFVDLGFDAPERHTNGTDGDPSDDYWIGGRAPAIDNLLMTAKVEFYSDLTSALSGAGNDGPETVIQRWTPMFEALFVAPADASDQAMEALNERNARWQSLINAGIGAIPFGELVDDKAINYMVNQAKANGVAPVLDTFLSTDNVQHGNQAQAQDGLMQYMTDSIYSAMSTHGSFDSASMSPEKFREIYQNNGKSASITENGQIKPYASMTPAEKSAFRSYIRSSGDTLGYAAIVNSVVGFTNDSDFIHDNAHDMSGKERGR